MSQQDQQQPLVPMPPAPLAPPPGMPPARSHAPAPQVDSGKAGVLKWLGLSFITVGVLAAVVIYLVLRYVPSAAETGRSPLMALIPLVVGIIFGITLLAGSRRTRNALEREALYQLIIAEGFYTNIADIASKTKVSDATCINELRHMINKRKLKDCVLDLDNYRIAFTDGRPPYQGYPPNRQYIVKRKHAWFGSADNDELRALAATCLIFGAIGTIGAIVVGVLMGKGLIVDPVARGILLAVFIVVAALGIASCILIIRRMILLKDCVNAIIPHDQISAQELADAVKVSPKRALNLGLALMNCGKLPGFHYVEGGNRFVNALKLGYPGK
ncbi:MAG: hypothetical protein IJJ14_04370 [Coriobacteriales bacterium]|nr:hypothetical protein [Coriobacteriales bacterium]MBQ6586114.1 hypothetical protein [Coriobacteriales bacterium]